MHRDRATNYEQAHGLIYFDPNRREFIREEKITLTPEEIIVVFYTLEVSPHILMMPRMIYPKKTLHQENCGG
jgi:hypothetical protein